MPNLIHYAIPFFVVTVILENYWAKKNAPEEFLLKDSLASISMGLGNVALGLLTKSVEFAIFYFFYQFRLFEFELNAAWYMLLLFGEDLAYYWNHRVAHVSRLFWASHIVHHSSQKYNLSTALRQTWTSGVYTSIFWIPLALIGFHPIYIFMQRSISLIYQYWIHTELIDKMGWFEYIFNTPSHHRVHHGSNIKYLDANYAGIFIIWDKMFGSFTKEEERPTYGLTTNISSYNPIFIAFHEWRTILKDVWHAPTFSSKLNYILNAPGWSHDGSRKTSKQLKKDAGLL
jgi:sterol desaturase/sphingolipid hydroxylase (fatty acid hydroxylase superfamily)